MDGPKKVLLGGLTLGKAKTKPKPLPSRQGLFNHVNQSEDPVDFVKSVSEKSIEGTAPPSLAKAPIVIPLTRNLHWPAQEDGAEAAAISAILSAKGEGTATSGSRHAVIPPLSGPAGTTSSEAPLLKSSMLPGLADIKNDTERFQADIELRAKNITVDSKCYSDVPICDFGEGLLRGMGWDGSRSESFGVTSARPARLGLGAKARPPSPPLKAKSVRRSGQAVDQAADPALSDDSWAKKAALKLRNQKLEIGSIVWLRGAHFVHGGQVTRAQIERTVGVPGFNRIEVALESTGQKVSVQRTDAVLVELVELSERPFIAARKREVSPLLEEYGISKRARHSIKKWAVVSIRVRIVAKGQHNRAKGDVVDVTEGGLATVELKDGTRVPGLGPEHLETLVPSPGDHVMVVRGKFRRRKAVIVKKDRDREEVLLELDGRRELLRFDDVTSLS